MPMAQLEEPADDSEYKVPNHSQRPGLAALLQGGSRGQQMVGGYPPAGRMQYQGQQQFQQKQASDDEVSDDAEFDDTDEHLIMTS